MVGSLSRTPGLALFPQSTYKECRWHGRKRSSATLKDYAAQHPELTEQDLQTLKQQFGHLFAAPSLAAYRAKTSPLVGELQR